MALEHPSTHTLLLLFHHISLVPLSWVLGGRVGQKTKRRPLNRPIRVQEGDIPFLGVGTGQGSARVPHLNIQVGASHPLSAPHEHILPTSSSGHSLEDLHLHPRLCKSQSRVWQDDALIPTEEHSPLQEPMEEHQPRQQMKKEVRCDVEEELDDDPTLPLDLTTFLVGV